MSNIQVSSVEVNKRERPESIWTRAGKKNTRIHVFPKGETLIEQLHNRRNRPISVFRDIVLKNVPEISTGDIKWSQTAGCSCGCSPGFIVNRKIIGSENRVIDIYIDAEIICEEV